MKRKATKICLWVAAGIYAWSAAASAMYCLLADKLDQLSFPFLQWFEIARFFGYNAATALWIIVAALTPSLVAVLVVMIRLQVTKFRGAKVYGETGWAAPKEMQQAGIKQRRTI